MSNLLTAAELAEKLHVSRRTVDRWREQAEGPAFVFVGPRLVRYRAVDVDAWCAARSVPL